VGDFSPDWLSLREPADARARSIRLLERLAGWLSERSNSAGEPTVPPTVLDLGCGTGSNLRYLAPRLAPCLGARQGWICLDRDAELLAALRGRTADWASCLGFAASARGDTLRIQGPGVDWDIRTQGFDLAIGADVLPVAGVNLVVASALLDLVSDAWIDDLLRNCARTTTPLLLTLTYDGRVVIEPEHRLDRLVIDLVNADQRRDKGLGPALGPSAPVRLAQLADRFRFSLDQAPSDWVIDPDETGLQFALSEVWASVALGQPAALSDPVVAASISDWHAARQAQIAAMHLRIRVGHQDALLLPGDLRVSRPQRVTGGPKRRKG
jgi:SAM-dependent methyltransferase